MPDETRDAAWDAAAKAEYLNNNNLPACGPWPSGEGIEFVASVYGLCPDCGLQPECYKSYLIWWKQTFHPTP